MAGRASAQAALETRRSVLCAAAELASVEGLDSVTIGRLADRLGMSKAGVIGQFRSKEKLQLETVDLVLEDVRTRVWQPVCHLDAGLPRLLAVCASWVRYAVDPGYAGGCLLTQVTYDYDGRTGAVHDRIAEGRARWRDTLRRDIDAAVAAGDLPPGTDAPQVVYGLESLAAGITPARLLHGDNQTEDWALRGMHAILGVPSTD
ncbi:TetR family transcriptional regulator [Streptomyces agglomeratus]|uniref:TetR family transcriptional regulator n=1 Tax=Streptomyces agglomeratus TaxID=285458 RepID=A0A1E5PGR8_9ACTN|nr:TetR/AcrR family transcriptional regulator [Streptomyces agglomeratus]OEJ28717.1 TetR family transcriptional regulator [Streptomyces agglomeratus]OEJ37211.1 TetR family transcriptional regulator [Streptomyces agglomeratus]OEJ48566.1 TetR family transcriptional regulator [Streptomyces agglomeratus]OEJ49768.1 TetR family transcriptional regulator [Streptomyces agglomeratus]OEJ57071.1 TetR family transcriptional regulator [Streptomyces agglomeratus]